jgi:penicillin-insensitive murein endopeptidase
MKHEPVLLLALGLFACGSTPHDVAAPQPSPMAAPAPAVVEAAPVQASPPLGAPGAAAPVEVDPLAALDPASSTSIGSPSNGHVTGAVPLPQQGIGYRHNDRRDENARFATVEVIRAIARAARVVHDALPGSELVVNDIGLEHGGRIAHHGSHRAGRDADILFYMLGDDGAPTPAVGAALDPDGIGFDYKELASPDDDVRVHFDAPRTWRFVQALLGDPDARVQRIFVVEHLRTKLLAAAKASSAPGDVVARFEDVTCQPSYPHDDHLHVRWYCTPEDMGKGCEDLPPVYPWREAELRALGLQPVLAGRVRSEDPAPIVTNEQAEKAVLRQRPHPSVLAFMKRRKAWEKQPHPGRPYCR